MSIDELIEASRDAVHSLKEMSPSDSDKPSGEVSKVSD